MPFTTITALLLGATAVSAAGAAAGGIAEKNKSDFSAAEQVQNAVRAKEISDLNAEDFLRGASKSFADSRAAGGGSGVQLNTGSNLIAAHDHAAEVENQARRIRAGGQTELQRGVEQAQLTKLAGKSAQTRGFFRAGSSLLSGASKTFS